MNKRQLRAVLLGSSAAVVLAVAAAPGAAAEGMAPRKAALKSALNALTARLERLEAKRLTATWARRM